MAQYDVSLDGFSFQGFKDESGAVRVGRGGAGFDPDNYRTLRVEADDDASAIAAFMRAVGISASARRFKVTRIPDPDPVAEPAADVQAASPADLHENKGEGPQGV